MAIIVNGKTYRNLQEQVFENVKDIEKLKQDTSPEVVKKLATEAVNDMGIEHFDDNDNDTLKITAANNQVWGNFGMYHREGNDWNTVLTVNPRDLRILTPYNTIVGKVEIYNPEDVINAPLFYVDGSARIGSLGVDYNLDIGKNSIRPSDDGNTYSVKLPAKSGTLALAEDIPANTGYIKAHTIENDADKNYTTTINLGSGNSGSTLHLEAPGDNGIATLELANEYNQGSTAIKFTADKLVFGNTEITEEQLQRLLQLIA